jgi:hypothetical protein
MTLIWDHGGRLGQLFLGMTKEEIPPTIPGRWGHLEPDVDPEQNPYWESETTGVTVQFVDGRAVSISGNIEFIVDGVNLVGMPLAAAAQHVGGLTDSYEAEDWEFVNSETGLHFVAYDGEITSVGIEDYSEVAESPAQ